MNGNLEKMAYRIPELENTCMEFCVRREEERVPSLWAQKGLFDAIGALDVK